MANDLNQSLHAEYEIDLREIFKILIESKKLIIVTILIFTITSIIYSLSLKPKFESSAILEIGHTELPDGTQKSVEKPSDLISNLNLYQYLNFQENNQDVSFKAIENKLIIIGTTSNSSEQNENLLAEIIRYVDERHSNLTLLTNNQKKDEISRQIEMIESELSFIRANELSKIEDRLAKLTNELPVIDLEISQIEGINNEVMLIERASNSPTLEQVIYTYKTQINALNREKSSYIQEIKSLNNQLQSLENDTLQSKQLFSLEQEKAILKNELQILMNQTQVKTQPIRNIKTNTVKPKTQLIITLGIIFGFIASIFLVFVINFLKSYRESEW